MAKTSKERQRKVDVEALSPTQAESIGQALGKKIGEITDKAAEDINQLAGIYGLKAKVAIQFFNASTGEQVS